MLEYGVYSALTVLPLLEYGVHSVNSTSTIHGPKYTDTPLAGAHAEPDNDSFGYMVDFGG
jgi:hypothetical protein